MMSNTLFIQNSIVIQASLARVWNVLTDPQETVKYMFGCEALSDWKEGSPLLWEGKVEGKPIVYVKGWIVKLQPEKHLSYTVIDPHNAAIPDLPENYLTVSYDLELTAEGVRFTVKQGDYNTVAEGAKRYAESYNGGLGWQPILEEIKKWAEQG